MSYFINFSLTQKGEEALLKSNNNINSMITFTNAAIGSGKLRENEIYKATKLEKEWIRFQVNTVRMIKNDDDENRPILRIEIPFINNEFLESKFMSELGLYAMNEDGEFLYGYSVTNDDGEVIPPGGMVPASYNISMDFSISSQKKINQTLNPEGFITKEVLEMFKDAIRNMGFRKIKGILNKNTNIINPPDTEFIPLSSKAILNIEGDVYIEGIHYEILNSNSIHFKNGIVFSEDMNYEIIDPLPSSYVEGEMKKFFDDLKLVSEDEKTAIRELGDAIIDKVKTEGTPIIEALEAKINEYYDLIGDTSGLTQLISTKFDDIEVDEEEGTMTFLSGGSEVKTITIPALAGTGGGGTGGGSVTLLKLSKINNPLSALYKQKLKLDFNFESKFMDGEITGDGALTLTVNNRIVSTKNISQGLNSIEIENFMLLGANNIKISVEDEYGTKRTLTYNIEVMELKVNVSLDNSLIYTDKITVRYTPIGAGIEKRIIFKLDGMEIFRNVTTAHNRELSFDIPKQSHGAHKLEVHIEAVVNFVEIVTSPIVIEFISADAGNNSPIIILDSYPETINQYETAVAYFRVFTPNTSLSAVLIKLNGSDFKTMEVDRTKQTLAIRFNEQGENDIEIISGSSKRSFKIVVEKALIEIKPEEEGLELYLSSQGRSNSDSSRDDWSYGTVKATMENFNWNSNGWLLDSKGNSILRLNAGASVEIPYHDFFNNSIKNTGKTLEIEFSTSKVEDFSKSIITSMFDGVGFDITSQNAVFSSALDSLETFYKEGERVKLAITVERQSANKLMRIYLNGILSGVEQYSAYDSFTQDIPQPIRISSEFAQVDIYGIRCYDRELNQSQVLNNYIADHNDPDEMIKIMDRNNLLNSEGEVDYNKAINYIPIITFTGKLPAYKGDKVKMRVEYDNRQDPSKSFVAESSTVDVQGTSSQYYPRKNWIFTFDKTNGVIIDGVKQAKYGLRDDSLAVNTFTLKADFAESSGVNNTGIAKIVNDLMLDLDILTPPQRAQKNRGEKINIRTTIDGFPILVFHKENENSKAEFQGKYNFNNDKKTAEIFGFTSDYPNCQSFEFLNNNSNRVVFHQSDYDEMLTDEKGGQYAAWTDDFEPRYPDDKTAWAEYKAGIRKPTALKRYTDWLLSTKDNPSKFKAEVSDYMDIDGMLFYYCITEFFGMVDQRAKNQFATTWDGVKWWFIFYDNDTIMGIDNSGRIRFNPSIEYHDKHGDAPVWNDKALSVLWNNVEEGFKNEIQEMYKRIRSNLDYDETMEYLNEEQSGKWAELIYNEDAAFKYIKPLTEGFYDGSVGEFIKTGEYLDMAQGSRADQRKYWASNRFDYMDSKYNAGKYLTDYITMRINVPTPVENPTTPEQIESNALIEKTLSVAPSDPGFDLLPFSEQYLTVKYENSIVRKRAIKGIKTRLDAPAGMVFADTNTIIYGASKLLDLGDIAAKYPSYISIGQAAKITDLKIGSELEGYRNTNLKILNVGNNAILKNLDIRNCVNLDGALDLSGCIQLENFYADNTRLSMAIFPEGGQLKNISLPSTVTNLTLIGHNNLEILKIGENSSLNTLRIEMSDSSKWNLGDLISNLIEEHANLTKIRITGLKESDSITLDTLNKIKDSLRGIDENGYETENPILEGTLTVVTDEAVDPELFKEKFPNLKIIIGVPKISMVVEIPSDNFVFSVQYGNSNINPLNKVEWGDGEETELQRNTSTSLTSGLTSLSHTYRKAGTYSITVVSSKKLLGIFKATGSRNNPGSNKYITDIIFHRTGYVPSGIAFNIAVQELSIPQSVTEMASFAVDSRIKNIKFSRIMNKIKNMSGVFTESMGIINVEMPEEMNILEDMNNSFNFYSNNSNGTIGTSTQIKNNIKMPKKLPKLKSMETAFKGYGAEEFTMPEEVPELLNMKRTFIYARHTKKINMPKELLKLNTLEETFKECESLISSILPEEMPELINMNNTYNGCTNLERVTLPKIAPNLKSMNGTFYVCSNLLFAMIPTSVTSMTNTFAGCTLLEDVVINSNIPPTINTGCFSVSAVNLTIYVPDEAVEAYKEATNWTLLADRIKPISERIPGDDE